MMVRAGSYVPPLSESGPPLIPGKEPVIAPGVSGYAIESEGDVFVPLIIAEKEGSGDVGRFLDSLDPRCCIPCVTSSRLEGMLRRRGWCPQDDGECVVWFHPAAALPDADRIPATPEASHAR